MSTCAVTHLRLPAQVATTRVSTTKAAAGEPVEEAPLFEEAPQFEPHPLLLSLTAQLREASTAATLELSRLHGAEFGLSGAQVPSTVVRSKSSE